MWLLEKQLAVLNALALICFAILFGHSEAIRHPAEFNETLLGQISIALIVVIGVAPRLILIQTTRGKVSNRKYFAYFIGMWILVPYFLWRLGVEKEVSHGELPSKCF